MITLAILKDEMVPGQRRAAGKMIRKIIIVGLDNRNIVIAEGKDPEHLVGQKFYGRLTHLASGLEDYGLDVEYARRQMLAFFRRHTGESAGDLTWAEMDDKFQVSKLNISGKFQLYADLKENGWKPDG